jgi:hypothetical protein
MLRRSDGRIRYFKAIVSYAGTGFRIAARSAPRHSAGGAPCDQRRHECRGGESGRHRDHREGKDQAV